jgi:hypothetical protein
MLRLGPDSTIAEKRAGPLELEVEAQELEMSRLVRRVDLIDREIFIFWFVVSIRFGR